jgi:hypothetical protein
MDLEKFFDKVNRDILISRVARKGKYKRVLRLIRRYLQAGLMTGGVASVRTQSTPRVARCHRCCPTSCWMIWTNSLKDEGIGCFIGLVAPRAGAWIETRPPSGSVARLNRRGRKA